MPRLMFVEGTSNKFWEGSVEGNVLVTSWGRVGTAGQKKEATLATPAAAQAELDKLVREKLKKGYVLEGGAPATVVAKPVEKPEKTPATSKVEAKPKKSADAAPPIAGTEGWRSLGELEPAMPSGSEAFDALLVEMRAGKHELGEVEIIQGGVSDGVHAAALAELGPGALDIGYQDWKDEVSDALPLRERKLYKTLYESIYFGGEKRKKHLAQVIAIVALRPAAHARLLAIALDTALHSQVRTLAARALTSPPFTVDDKDAAPLASKETLRALGAVFEGPGLLDLYGRAARGVLLAVPPAEAFSLLAPHLERGAKDESVEAATRAEGVLWGLNATRGWETHAPFVARIAWLFASDDIRNLALTAMSRVPIQDDVVVAVIGYAEKDLEAGSFFNEAAHKILAGSRDRRAARALAGSLLWLSQLADQTLTLLRELDDASAVPRIRAAIVAYKKKKNAPLIDKAEELIRHLERNGPAPAEAPAAAVKPAPRASDETREPATALQSIDEQLADIRQLIGDAGLTKKEADILRLVRRGIQCHTRRAASLPLGASKIGGIPDLPKGAVWPEVKGYPLDFVGQIRLDDIAALDADKKLPKAGLLSFFAFDVPSDDEGAPEYLIASKVIFTPDTSALTPLALPPASSAHRADLEVKRPYPLCAIAFHPVLKLPPPTNPAMKTSGLTAKEREKYEESVEVSPAVAHQLLGYRDRSYDAEQSADTRLLFQCISDDAADMSWGDADHLYFYVSEAALAARDFDKAFSYSGD